MDRKKTTACRKPLITITLTSKSRLRLIIPLSLISKQRLLRLPTRARRILILAIRLKMLRRIIRRKIPTSNKTTSVWLIFTVPQRKQGHQ